MKRSKIEWLQGGATWSPWRGCTKVSRGCENCYAEKLSRRNPAVLGEWGPGRPRVLSKSWVAPERWSTEVGERECARCSHDAGDGELIAKCRDCRGPMNVFPSLCDWLDDEVPVEWLARFLSLIRRTPNLRWLLLTKRPQNFDERMALVRKRWEKAETGGVRVDELPWLLEWLSWGAPPANVCVGVSAENQILARRRIGLLSKIPAAMRFVSAEPLIEPVRMSEFQPGQVDWVIVGGESGFEARACFVGWVAALIDDCRTLRVPCFVKQLGGWPMVGRPGATVQRLVLQHAKGGDPSEWPEHLRVRQWPRGWE